IKSLQSCSLQVSLENTVQHPPLPPMSTGSIPNSLGLRLEAEPRHFANNGQVKIKCFAEVGSRVYEAERKVMKAYVNNQRLSAGDMHAAARSIHTSILVQLLTAILALVLLTTAAVSRVSLPTIQSVWSREASKDVRARRKEENPEKRIPRETVHSTALRKRRYKKGRASVTGKKLRSQKDAKKRSYIFTYSCIYLNRVCSHDRLSEFQTPYVDQTAKFSIQGIKLSFSNRTMHILATRRSKAEKSHHETKTIRSLRVNNSSTFIKNLSLTRRYPGAQAKNHPKRSNTWEITRTERVLQVIRLQERTYRCNKIEAELSIYYFSIANCKITKQYKQRLTSCRRVDTIVAGNKKKIASTQINVINDLPHYATTDVLRLDEVYGLEPLLFINFPPIDHPSERGTSLESITSRDVGTYS
ncbi:hypothetical protein ALC62_13550, partial [Cyphomyrmex costatus]